MLTIFIISRQNNTIYPTMIKPLIIGFCLFAVIISVDPPVWPQTFSQSFVQGDSTIKQYTVGKLWYDIKNQRQRIDVTHNLYQPICMSLSNNPNASCTQLYVNHALYVILPEKNLCCKCCTPAVGCTAIDPDWVQDFSYQGQATLSGQSFYKWSYEFSEDDKQSYYASQDAERVPRRTQVGTVATDYIMNTYTKAPISDEIFKLSNNCLADCPKTSYCSIFSQQKKVTYSLQDMLMKRNSKKNAIITESVSLKTQ